MRFKFTFLLGFLCLFLLSTPALAIPMLSLDGGTAGFIPNNAANDILDDIYGAGVTSRAGYYGAEIRLTEEANVTFTHLYYEAGWSNDFYLGDDFLFNNKTSGALSVEGPFLLSGGIIPFHFQIDNDRIRVYNGSNPDDYLGGAAQNFFVSFDGDATATAGTSLVVFLDDSGAGPDDNHDDMAIRISIAPVPEPATSLLLGIGLVSLVGVARKKFSVKLN